MALDIRVTIDTARVEALQGDIRAALDRGARRGISRALKEVGTVWGTGVEGEAPYRTGRLVRSLRYRTTIQPTRARAVGRVTKWTIRLDGIFYLAAVNARTKFVRRGTERAAPHIRDILSREVRAGMEAELAKIGN